MATTAYTDEKPPSVKRRCPFCAEEIQADAKKCKHCGEYLDEALSHDRAVRKWSPGAAALLSLIFPGGGQMYKGRVFDGFIWLILVPLGYYFLFVPGLVLHVLCIASACSGDPTEEGKTTGF